MSAQMQPEEKTAHRELGRRLVRLSLPIGVALRKVA